MRQALSVNYPGYPDLAGRCPKAPLDEKGEHCGHYWQLDQYNYGCCAYCGETKIHGLSPLVELEATARVERQARAEATKARIRKEAASK